MQKDQLAKSTIKPTVRRLKHIGRFCNLNKPDEVITFLAHKKGKNSYIDAIAHAYNRYVRYNNLKWKMPKIKRTSQPPYLPSTEELTILCSGAGTKYSLILNMFKDTGMRPIEMHRLKLSWIDLNKGIIQVETAKYGLGRNLKLKQSTFEMLKAYIAKNNFKQDDKLFPTTKTMRRVFIGIRQRTAKKLHRPEFNKITLYSFRHYFASHLYNLTREYLLVKQKMGHRRIEQTITYIHTIADGFDDNDFTTATAETVKDARKLIEDGYSKVDEFNGIHIYKKRK